MDVGWSQVDLGWLEDRQRMEPDGPGMEARRLEDGHGVDRGWSQVDLGWLEDGHGMDRGWSQMDLGWRQDGWRMDVGWLEDGQRTDA